MPAACQWEMATVSAGILTIFVIASLPIRVHSFPEGCTKLRGSPKDGNEYSVKVYSTVKAQTIVKMMLALSSSECEGFQWRSNNASDWFYTTVTASDLSYIEGFGFSARLSDAAVMWVCDNDAVDFIITSTAVTEPVTVTATDEPVTITTHSPDIVTASGSTPTSAVPSTDDDLVGSGVGTVLPATTPTSTTPISTAKCNKLMEYKDERQIIENQFVIYLYQNTTFDFIDSFIEDVKVQSNRSNSGMIIGYIIKFEPLKFLLAEMNMKAMEYVCENPRVKSISHNFIIPLITIIPPGPPIKRALTTTTINTPRTIVTATTATTTPSTTTEASTSSTLQCNKLWGAPIRPQDLNLCRIYMTKNSTKADCRRFIGQMRAMNDDILNDIRFELQTVGHDKERPMILVKLNQKAVDMVCKSKAIDLIITI